MYARVIESILARYAQIYPVVGITGPRQSGKTTTARHFFSHLPYVSFENLDVRGRFEMDPRGFLAEYPDGAIFDEVQYAPQILSYLQQIVDEDQRVGRFVLTGSQNFAISQTVSQTLAGRIGMLRLLPLSLSELRLEVDWQTKCFLGGYPRLHAVGQTPEEFYPSYVSTYIERDVRQIATVDNLFTFQRFLKICAGRVGQVVNYSSMADAVGITHTTARRWIEMLQASYILFLVPPYHRNFNKRLSKMPKMYFYDTGLVCHLLGIESADQIFTHYYQGAIFENLVILELLKGRVHRGKSEFLYFWRDRGGNQEVDIITEWDGKVRAFQVKSGQSFKPDFLKHVQDFCALASDAQGYLVYNGADTGKVNDTTLLPLTDLEHFFDTVTS